MKCMWLCSKEPGLWGRARSRQTAPPASGLELGHSYSNSQGTLHVIDVMLQQPHLWPRKTSVFLQNVMFFSYFASLRRSPTHPKAVWLEGELTAGRPSSVAFRPALWSAELFNRNILTSSLPLQFSCFPGPSTLPAAIHGFRLNPTPPPRTLPTIEYLGRSTPVCRIAYP